MKKKGRLILFFIVVAFSVTFLIRTVSLSNRHVDLHDIELLNLEKNELIQSNNQIKESIGKIQSKINESKQTTDSLQVIEHLKSELEGYKQLSGECAVGGEGVIIIVNDSAIPLNDFLAPEDVIVHDVNLRILVDELRQAGAEAISVNGTRIIFGYSKINCSGPTININKVEHGAPYIIKAIGDRYKLQRKMIEDGSYANTLKHFALDIEVNTKVYMEINGYRDSVVKKYAEVVK